jgi:enolase
VISDVMDATAQALIVATNVQGTLSKMYTATVYALRTGMEPTVHNTTVSVMTHVSLAVAQNQLTVSPVRRTLL